VRLLRLGYVGPRIRTPGSGRFAQAAIARLGQAVWLGSLGTVVQALFEAVSSWEAVA